jgi:hypothetical protein
LFYFYMGVRWPELTEWSKLFKVQSETVPANLNSPAPTKVHTNNYEIGLSNDSGWHY